MRIIAASLFYLLTARILCINILQKFSYVSTKYFGKRRAWLVTQLVEHDSPDVYADLDKSKLREALLNISDEIRELADKLQSSEA